MTKKVQAGKIEKLLMAREVEESAKYKIKRLFLYHLLLNTSEYFFIETAWTWEIKIELNRALETLNEQQAQVLRLRYGLHDGKMRTLREIGEKFKVSRERIRQIEATAFRLLTHPSRRGKMLELEKGIDKRQNNKNFLTPAF